MKELHTIQTYLVDSNRGVLDGRYDPIQPSFKGVSTAEFVIWPAQKKVNIQAIDQDLIRFTLFFNIAFAFSKKIDINKTMMTLLSQIVNSGPDLQIVSFNYFSEDVFKEMFEMELTNNYYSFIWYQFGVRVTQSTYDCGECIEFIEC